MYVHRSGRTARGDEVGGVSILLCAPGEAVAMARLVGKVHAIAEGTGGTKSLKSSQMRSLDVDRTVVKQLKRRVELAKKIADAEQANQKTRKDEDWVRNAAEELGVDISDGEVEVVARGKKKGGLKNKGKSLGGRGQEREWDDDANDGAGGKGPGANASKDDVRKWKWELKEELQKKINKGFSTKYLTAGNLNLAEHLLNGGGHDVILGEGRNGVLEEMS